MILDEGCTSGAAATGADGALTIGMFLDAMNRIRRTLDRPFNRPLLPTNCVGVRIQESLYATTTEPVRLHKKRHNQSASYHRRIQKKWTKRWGVRQVPCAYVIDNRVIGGHGRTLVAHPSLMAQLRRSTGIGL